MVGKSVSFGINASQAGAGNLEIIVAVNGKNVPNFVQSEGNARFKVNFRPTEPASHSLSVKFNGLPVPGSPFSCNISPAPMSQLKTAVSGDGIKQASVRADNAFEIDGVDGLEPSVSIASPNGDTVPCKIVRQNDKYTVKFRPSAVGRHLISVTSEYQIKIARSDGSHLTVAQHFRPFRQPTTSTSADRRSRATCSMCRASQSLGSSSTTGPPRWAFR